ncbi:MAG: hypothetical protein KDK39_15640, partial [Leptospiraceae bacterium]|nr:hypothetical protein [Leptospiraceae bacterium]
MRLAGDLVTQNLVGVSFIFSVGLANPVRKQADRFLVLTTHPGLALGLILCPAHDLFKDHLHGQFLGFKESIDLDLGLFGQHGDHLLVAHGALAVVHLAECLLDPVVGIKPGVFVGHTGRRHTVQFLDEQITLFDPAGTQGRATGLGGHLLVLGRGQVAELFEHRAILLHHCHLVFDLHLFLVFLHLVAELAA